jgi:hypothetical protein
MATHGDRAEMLERLRREESGTLVAVLYNEGDFNYEAAGRLRLPVPGDGDEIVIQNGMTDPNLYKFVPLGEDRSTKYSETRLSPQQILDYVKLEKKDQEPST